MSDRIESARFTDISELVFVGFNHRVFALDRHTGEKVWSWKGAEGMSNYVAMLLDDDRLIVSIEGYTWALDAATGAEMWHNAFRGEGTGIPSLASVAGSVLGGGTTGQST